MNKARFPMVIIIVCLVAVALIAVQTFQRTTPAQGSAHPVPSGIGDLRRFEAQQAIPEIDPSRATGFGELRRFESEQSSAVGSSPARSGGFGELRRFEAEQSQPNP